jgi:hypothetical protein
VPEGFDYDMWLGQAPYEPYNKGRVAGTFGGQSGWRAWQDYSGGMMTDWGGHKFGAALFALGLEETGPVEIIPPDGKDYQYLTYRFANGVLMYHAPGAGVDITFKGTLGEAGGKQGRSGPAVPPADMPGYRGSGGIHGDWFYCTRTRQRPFQDVEIGHRAATVCHLGNIAYWLNRRLRWDPVKEEILGDPEAGRWLDRPRRSPWVL